MATPNEQDRERNERLRRERDESSENLNDTRQAGTTGQWEKVTSDTPAPDQQADGDETAEPPHTTTGKVTAPKFGSAGSGGAELEPGPERP